MIINRPQCDFFTDEGHFVRFYTSKLKAHKQSTEAKFDSPYRIIVLLLENNKSLNTKVDSLCKMDDFISDESKNISKQISDLHKLYFQPMQALSSEDPSTKFRMEILNKKTMPNRKP